MSNKKLLPLICVIVACGARPDLPRATLATLRAAYPGAAALLDAPRSPPETLPGERGGFRLRVPHLLSAELAPRLDGSMKLVDERSGFTLSVRRPDARPVAGLSTFDSVSYADALPAANVQLFTHGQGIEELLQLGSLVPVRYELTLPPGATMVQASNTLIEVRDAAGVARWRMTADQAWDAAGRKVAVNARISGSTIMIALAGAPQLPVLLDPQWSSTAAPATPRYNHTSTLLPGGKLLIAGGIDGSGNVLTSAELYDPATDTFTTTGSMAGARYWHTATVLSTSGQVLVTGGRTSGGPTVASTELYDPISGLFSAGPAMAAARSGHVTVAPAETPGQAWVIGGFDGGGALSSVERFVLSGGVLSVGPAAPMATARTGHAAVATNGKIYALGGQTNVAGQSLPETASCEVLDLTAGSWKSIAPLPSPSSGHGATVIADGSVWVTGGRATSAGSTVYNMANVHYVPSSNSWSTGGNLVAPRAQHTASLLPSGQILIAGGSNNGGTIPAGQSAELLDPTSGNDGVTTPLVVPRFNATATVLVTGNVLVVGGQTVGGTVVPSAEQLDLDEYTNTASTGVMAVPRTNPTATLLGAGNVAGKVLVAGGLDGSGTPTGVYELFDPVTNSFSTTATSGQARYWHTATALENMQVLIAGGHDASGALSSAETWDPVSGSATATAIATARFQHAATLLPNGKVLITGGYGSTGVPLTSAELWDPVSRSSSPAGNMTVARAEHSASLLPDGRVLIAGGMTPFVDTCPSCGVPVDFASCPMMPACNPGPSGNCPLCGSAVGCPVMPACVLLSTAPSTSAEIYNPATGTFTATASMPFQHSGHSATVSASGKVTIVGGDMQSCGTCTAAMPLVPGCPLGAPPCSGPVFGSSTSTIAHVFVDEFDPASGTWRSETPMQVGHAQHTATLLPDDRILVVGGNTTTCVMQPMNCNTGCPPQMSTAPPCSTSAPAIVQPGNGIEVRDPAAGTNAPHGTGTIRASAAATLLADGRAFIVGGTTSVTRADLFTIGFNYPTAYVPSITSAPAGMIAGQPSGPVVGVGLGGFFSVDVTASGGNGAQDSPSNVPVIALMGLDNNGLSYGAASSWTTTQVGSFLVPVAAGRGPSLVFDIANGVVSNSAKFALICPAGSVACSGQCVAGSCCGAADCTAPPPCHLAAGATCGGGVCSYPTAGDGASCSAGNLCLVGATCSGGVCGGGVPRVCSASDACHTAGNCVPATGACTNPLAPNGTSCNDGVSCTFGDSCTNGSCAGTAINCTSDACTTRSCNGTASCSVSFALSGSPCDDGNLCSYADACNGSGSCAGIAISCTSDACAARACNGTSSCSVVAATNGTACNDGNACTSSDVCSAGVCGGTAKSCPASDQCHTGGSCDPTSGLCSNPIATNGTACNDGNACTSSDVCSAGVCGGTAKSCPASDQCHTGGSCDPTSGLCSNPVATNGTACNDGNACTSGDVCTAGVCGGAAKSCPASDQCHTGGSCDPTSGLCSNPVATNGTACNDGNACTSSDVCTAGVCGGTAKSCPASDQCHTGGSCDPTSGLCSNPVATNGTACNDGNACTSSDVCSAGVCGGTAKSCPAIDQCHTVGTCDTSSGICSTPQKATGTGCDDGNSCTYNDQCGAGGSCAGTAITCTSDTCMTRSCNGSVTCTSTPAANGTACNDGNACTSGDACSGGVCGGVAKSCGAADQCHSAGSCDPTSGLCSNPPLPNGTGCNDGNACTSGESCQAGACVGGTTRSCSAADVCHVAGTCDPSSGVCSTPAAPDGTGCSDGNACTVGDSCQSGSCAPGSSKSCGASDQCHGVGTCDSTTGVCSNPTLTPGTSCDDGNPCTFNDQCGAGGTCTGTPITCASDSCTSRACNGTATCTISFNAAGTSCSDGNACTFGDACNGAGICAGTPVTCASDTCATRACNGTSSCTIVSRAPDGTGCGGDRCVSAGTCQLGVCSGATQVTCTASDQCHVAGSCDPTSGLCSNPAAPGNTSCSDGNACTIGDTCQAGACTAGMTRMCSASDQCHVAGSCDPTSGLCSNPVVPDGTTCSSGDACAIGRTCSGGVCGGGGEKSCTPPDQCHVAVACDAASGVCSFAAKADGAACDDGNPCTVGDSCSGGACAGTPKICAGVADCYTSACDPSSGACGARVPRPAGVVCDDGDACTSGDVCSGDGSCRGSSISCDTPPNRVCAEVPGVCGSGQCSYTPRVGAPCDDGDPTTADDSCGADGLCHGVPAAAKPEPTAGATASGCALAGGGADAPSPLSIFLLVVAAWLYRRHSRGV